MNPLLAFVLGVIGFAAVIFGLAFLGVWIDKHLEDWL